MDWRKPQTWLLFAVLLGLSLVVVWTLWPAHAVRHPPGILVAASPRQEASDKNAAWRHNEYWIKPQARFQLEARVLGAKGYSSGREADLSPLDLVLGWRKMSDQVVVDKISISQFHRFYTWWADPDTPATREEITTCSANMHLIPATAEIEGKLLSLLEGEVVELQGYLVEVEHPDGWVWRTSTTRDDTGPGACELIWVESVQVRAHP